MHTQLKVLWSQESPKVPIAPSLSSNEQKVATVADEHLAKRANEQSESERTQKKLKAEVIPVRLFPPVSMFDTCSSITGLVSEHGQGVCFRDSEIIDVLVKRTSHKEVLKTTSGKAVLQQQSVRGCTAACVEMLRADQGFRVDWNRMKAMNLGTNETMSAQLRLSGIELKVCERVSFDALQDLLNKYGSAIVGVQTDIKAHAVILDRINLKEKYVDLRDPYHGWAVRVTLEAFQKAIGSHTETIQALPSTATRSETPLTGPLDLA